VHDSASKKTVVSYQTEREREREYVSDDFDHIVVDSQRLKRRVRHLSRQSLPCKRSEILQREEESVYGFDIQLTTAQKNEENACVRS
jgi:hypothetical protein